LVFARNLRQEVEQQAILEDGQSPTYFRFRGLNFWANAFGLREIRKHSVHFGCQYIMLLAFKSGLLENIRDKRERVVLTCVSRFLNCS
jgi:hypothetical protein